MLDAHCCESEVGQSVPWDKDDPPPLAAVPFAADGEYQAFLYKRDMFHVIKHGLGREAVASILLMLSYMGYVDIPETSRTCLVDLAVHFEFMSSGVKQRKRQHL